MTITTDLSSTLMLADGSKIILSDDQQQARCDVLTALIDNGQPEAVLSGPAGSGKTTLMRALIQDLRDAGRLVKLLAPTGKAARRLHEVTGEATSTIHRPLYESVSSKLKATKKERGAYKLLAESKPDTLPSFEDWLRALRAETNKAVEEDLLFSDPRQVGDAGTVLVVDESSMVGLRLASDLRSQLSGAQVLWVGDREQLPPVNDRWGCEWGNPTALLTQIHRQAADSPIIGLATAIRSGQDWHRINPEPPVYRDACSPQRVAEWLAQQHSKNADAVCLTFTNAKRHKINALTRAVLGVSGEVLTVGERVLVTTNNYHVGLFNGEVVRVAGIRERESVYGHAVHELQVEGVNTLGGQPLWIGYDPEALAAGQRPKGRGLLSIDYGYCLSIHKSQGSQWHTVGLIHDGACWGLANRNADDYRRLIYTAVTRAAERLLVFNQ